MSPALSATCLERYGVTGLYFQSEQLAFAWGDWAHRFQEYVGPDRTDPRLGTVAADGLPVDLAALQSSASWELHIALSRRRPERSALMDALSYALADERVAREIVQLYRADIPGERVSELTPMLPLLRNLGARRQDFRVATVWIDHGFFYAMRVVRVFWTSEWMVAIWGAPGQASTGTYRAPVKWPFTTTEARSAALPARRPEHLNYDTPRAIGGNSAVIRLAFFVAGHHKWAVEMISDTLERWQASFFERASARSASAAPTQRLSDVGNAIVLVRPALHGVLRTVKSPSFNHTPALGSGAESAAEALRQAAADLRDSYALAAQRAALAEASRAEKKVSADRRLQRIASGLAAFVLWPGLVAAIYGADVRGLPGQGDRRGLWYLGAVSVLGAGITLVLLLVVLRDRADDAQ